MEEAPKEGEPLKLNGSAVVVSAVSREEVVEQLKKDIYSTSGVWDLSKVCHVLQTQLQRHSHDYRSRYIPSSVHSARNCACNISHEKVWLEGLDSMPMGKMALPKPSKEVQSKPRIPCFVQYRDYKGIVSLDSSSGPVLVTLYLYENLKTLAR